MKLSVFIRTYKGDAAWLPYCLEGIERFVKYDEIVVVTPDPSVIKPLLKPHHKLVTTRDVCDGYMSQQIDKIRAYEWCTGDIIMYVDSDTVFYKHCSVENFIYSGGVNLLRTPYSQIDSPWQRITEKAIGAKSDWEYMRRFPLVYWRETLLNISGIFPTLPMYISRQKNRAFSEFNFIGQFIELYETHKYNLLDTNNGLPEEYCKQFWSWGGLTQEVKNEINQLFSLGQ